MFGFNDPAAAQSGVDSFVNAIRELGEYFTGIGIERRPRPTEDLSSVIANATVDGRLLELHECVAYFVLIASAGHDTTAGAMSGGLLALLEHPQQMAQLRADETLLSKSVEEMIRWTTTTKCFLRTAATDYELRGRSIVAGERLLLSYASANFDEDQFTQPERFDIARWPNKHIACGFGTHFCLGVQLARIEMRCLFRELIARTADIELTGLADFKPKVFVGGLKQLPVLCRHA